ncbi:MAG: DUF2244 domain-containing protein [Steroidobacter sp.]
MAIGDAAQLPSPTTVAPGTERRVELAARCSLTPRTAHIFIASIAATTFAVAAPFAMQGFWLVLLFAALEIALLVYAVRASMRAGLERETICITHDCVTITHHRCGGERSSVFPRHWSRVTLRTPPAALHPSRLIIESHGCVCEVGRFLTEDERRSLAVRLKQLVGNMNESPAL